MRQYQVLFDALDAQPLLRAPPEISDQVMEAIRAEAAWRKVGTRFWPLWAACVAACVALVCLFIKTEAFVLPHGASVEIQQFTADVVSAWQSYATWTSSEMVRYVSDSVSTTAVAIESTAEEAPDDVLWGVCGLAAFALMANVLVRAAVVAPQNAMRNAG